MSDYISPPIARERPIVHSRIETRALRQALEQVSDERDALFKENDNYRRLIFALLTAVDGRIKIDHSVLLRVPIRGTIYTQYDARDKSVSVWMIENGGEK